jgi:hypothetical protein
MSQQPDYLSLIYRRLEQIEAQIQNLRSAVALDDYAELRAAATTERAKEIATANGLSGPKQLLLAALKDYLDRPPYLTEEEERKFLEVRDRILAARHHPPGNT